MENKINLSDFFYEDQSKGEDRKYLTDKGDVHNYIRGYYNSEFTEIRESEINILEIGIAYSGSIKLWRDWFIKSSVFAIENDKNLISDIPGINIIFADAYNEETLKNIGEIEFDYIIDDGPHTISSQIYAVKNWSKKLKIGGKLIIEDIQNFDDIELLKKETPYQNRVIDLRLTSFKRYDDVIFELTKNF